MSGIFRGVLLVLILEICGLILTIRLRKKMASWLAVFLCLALGCFIFFTSIFLGATGFFMTSTDNVPYDFPVTQNDSEWTEFTTKQEMLDVCQIPQDKLESMTTGALLETVLNYPLINTYSAFNSVEDAYSTMSNDFNGFHALFSRDDVSTVLEKKYLEVQKMKESGTESVSSEESFLSEVMEYLLACNQIKNGE